MIDGRNWGVLEVDASEPRAFDDGDVSFMTTYANMVGMALARFEAEQKALTAAQDCTKKEDRWRTLVRELQHRTKNNLQTILSFLSIQRRNANSATTKQRLSTVMERVQAISLAHDQLSLKEGASYVNFGQYLRSLCANIDPGCGNIKVEVEVHATGETIPLDRAVPAGLIVNELVTNALKYAFDGSDEGMIHVALTMEPETGEACIAVEDNGKGMGPPREGGLGLILVQSFAQQLAGRVQRDPIEKGTRVRICFPVAM